jgi:hypothetical protein
MKVIFLVLSCLLWSVVLIAQQQSVSVDTAQAPPPVDTDTVLRIINLNPYFNQHVDSSFAYQLEINKPVADYYWYMKSSPAGLKINKDNGLLTYKADKSYFLSGKLKYDYPYKVQVGVQNLRDANERIDTTFTLIFYNTEIIPSRVKPTVAGTMTAEEGEAISFRVLCETGNFPIESILFTSNIPIKGFNMPAACGDEFSWTPPYDFVKETDSARVKVVYLSFIGSNKFREKDTAVVRLIIKETLNYPLAKEEYNVVSKNLRVYILQLKYAFLQLDKGLKKTKTTRTAFDLTSASTALTGTVLSTSSSTGSQKAGKIFPSVGVAMVPIKEATAPNKVVEQNQASLIRSSIKRLEYILFDNSLTGEKDPAIAAKTNKLKEEMKQNQMQLIDIPVDFTIDGMTEKELNNYFNSPKVNKKYRLRGK